MQGHPRVTLYGKDVGYHARQSLFAPCRFDPSTHCHSHSGPLLFTCTGVRVTHGAIHQSLMPLGTLMIFIETIYRATGDRMPTCANTLGW